MDQSSWISAATAPPAHLRRIGPRRLNDPEASSYEEHLRTILELEIGYDALTEGYRRMAFNVMAVNQDDHVKNLSFQMEREGTWSLAPAYDVTFARGMGCTGEHQMRIQDKMSGIRREDLLAVASEFGVKKADTILAKIRDVLDEWERHAIRYAVDKDVREIIREEIDRREKVLAGTQDEMPTEPPELLVGQPES